MIYVSMVEIFPASRGMLAAPLGADGSGWTAAAAFFAGMLVIAVIDRIVPSEENPHEPKLVEGEERSSSAKLMRTGVFTAAAIAIHNFPEGLATFVSALQDPGIAIPIVAAIAIHNIPRASPCPCPYTTRPARAGARSCIRSCPGSRSRPARSSAGCCSCP